MEYVQSILTLKLVQSCGFSSLGTHMAYAAAKSEAPAAAILTAEHTTVALSSSNFDSSNFFLRSSALMSQYSYLTHMVMSLLSSPFFIEIVAHLNSFVSSQPSFSLAASHLPPSSDFLAS